MVDKRLRGSPFPQFLDSACFSPFFHQPSLLNAFGNSNVKADENLDVIVDENNP